MDTDMNRSNGLTHAKARQGLFKLQGRGTQENFNIKQETQNMTTSANTQHMCLDGFLIEDSTKNTGEKQKKRNENN